MKRFLTILLLAAFLFNLFGYRIVLSYLESRQDSALQARIENNQVSDQHLISVKTALNLPYYSSSEKFETAYGSIDINGVEYKYVKRRVLNDSLEVLCYPNLAKKTITDAKNEMFQHSSEAPLTEKSKKSSSGKNVLPEVWQQVNNSSYYEPTYSKTFGLYHQPFSPSLSLKVDEQPPDSMSV